MSVKLLNAKAAAKRLEQLIEDHSEIHLAVAWGSNGHIADCLLRNQHKFSSVTFGLAFCQTDPDLVDRLVGVKNAFVADGGNKTFHPKVYYFQTGDVSEAIIGSSNFTAGGLDRNWEASVHIKGASSATIFNQVRECLGSYAGLRKAVTQHLAESYRLWFAAASTLKKARNPILPGSGLPANQFNSPLVKMRWDEYVRAAEASPHHNFDARLSLLRECQTMFASVKSFAGLTSSQWKAIAGVIGSNQRINEGLDGHDWAWFGSMKGMGDFANRISEQDAFLARAVDCIPRHGEVTKAQFEDFCGLFLQAFAQSSRIGGVPTATRLLAMKRPDTFVCVSKPNLAGLSSALAFPKSSLQLDNYWDRVVEPIRLSFWYNTPRPKGKYAELWDGRAAMLDAIYYEA
ncbi:phospholipase D family protein [Sedimentimonas flavescens]|uniref:phospholipase D family protein n=1 Tax=Sedimentimonas flavescens TaxID=2851012 RepID=UPI001C4A6237|nr:phospholipase D family protein [Sedimentimonas flavescens]MBW0159491.1 phospholipase D family protein [Sedimentimonas flavescens]